jgi:hypothetical protein
VFHGRLSQRDFGQVVELDPSRPVQHGAVDLASDNSANSSVCFTLTRQPIRRSRSRQGKENNPMKVIGAGFGRTGTMSMQAALNTLDYRCDHMKEVP